MKWRLENRNMRNMCNRCILDDTVQDIWYNKNGECKYCEIHDELEKIHPLGSEMEKELERVVSKIKKAGKGKKYDCIAGVSGGRDSSYTLLVAKRLGLRPLAVHFDNGWNTDISVRNIKNACEICEEHTGDEILILLWFCLKLTE